MQAKTLRPVRSCKLVPFYTFFYCFPKNILKYLKARALTTSWEDHSRAFQSHL